MRTTVIAEVGTTWRLSRPALTTLFQVATGADCDFLKLQYCSNPKRLAELRGMSEMPNAYRFLQFKPSWCREWFDAIRSEARAFGIGLACSAYLADDIDTIAPLVDAVKIASFESGTFPNGFKHAGPLWVSAGMATESQALAIVKGWDLAKEKDLLFHCVSAYPAPLSDSNLGVIQNLRQSLTFRRSVRVGLSDHSRWTGMGAAAVLAGAQALEVHVRLDSTPDDHPDCAVALRPAELKEYVANVRFAETLLGDGVKRVMDSEKESLQWKR